MLLFINFDFMKGFGRWLKRCFEWSGGLTILGVLIATLMIL